MNLRGSEPPGMCGLGKQVTEAKGPLELQRKKAKVHSFREGREKAWDERKREKAESFILRGFICPKAGVLGEFSGKETNRIVICFPVISFQGCRLY